MQTDYAKILIDFMAIPKHKQARTFMEISGYPHYENVCSNILAFYLNPSNEHGLKDLVLHSLLQLVEADFCVDLDFETIEIHREYETINGNRLDIVIFTENRVIGIENKIFHSLHNDLSDYSETIKSECNGEKKPICIVLSLNKLTSEHDLEKIEASNFINITYGQFFQNIRQYIGKYLTCSNISYINHLTDFIKSIDNLTSGGAMENKELRTFFKNNFEKLEELTASFNEYKESLYQKINQLHSVINKSEIAPTSNKQWIYKGSCVVYNCRNCCCLVHDYTINSKYISVDTYIHVPGWEIQIFGRDNPSTNFLFNVMCQDKDFLPKPFESYERTKEKRLIYQRFDTETDISNVAEVLADLLARIEKYKNER